MKSWFGRPAQCLFCDFHSTLTRPTRVPKARQRRSVSTSRDARSREGAPIRRLFGVQRTLQNKRDNAGSRHHDERDKLRAKTEVVNGVLQRSFQSTVRSHLGLLKKSLEVAKVEGSDLTELASLDPDQKYWREFADNVLRIVEKSPWSLEGKLRRLHSNLHAKLKAQYLKSGGSSEMDRILHYAFLDHILQNPSPEELVSRTRYADLRHPTEWYAQARALQRDIHLHVGPTNSGKTYNALKRLEESGNGFYAGPLRLLAHEVYSRFKAKGIPCDLVTGDDIRKDENTDVKIYSSTVEMVDTVKQVEVAVIDEIQMMGHEDRGWAWTRAFLGANAKEVHLCGETRVVPLVRELAASMGDNLHIHQYDRLNPLKAMSRSLRGDLRNLRKGDCIVSFTIMGIHALKKQIELETGRRVAIVYGSLPPETRARQAALFNEPDNDYDFLVASNAIGMGLNLAIKRVIFESLVRWNGTYREPLSIPEIKQIAGRAGRYRPAPREQDSPSEEENPANIRSTQYHATTMVGLVTCLDEADLPTIQQALRSEPEPLKAAGVLPPIDIIEEYAARLPKGLPLEYVLQRLCETSTLNPRFQLSNFKDVFAVLKHIEPIKGLSVADRCVFGASPADHRNPNGRKVITALARCLAERRSVTVIDVAQIPLEALELPMSGDRSYLLGLEDLHKSLILFLWLSYRYIDVFKDQAMAFHAKELVEEKINATLLEFSANPRLRSRLRALKEASAGLRSSPSPPVPLILPNTEPSTIEVMDSDSADLPVDWTQSAAESELQCAEMSKTELLAAGQ